MNVVDAGAGLFLQDGVNSSFQGGTILTRIHFLPNVLFLSSQNITRNIVILSLSPLTVMVSQTFLAFDNFDNFEDSRLDIL